MHFRLTTFVLTCGLLATGSAFAEPIKLKIAAAVPEGSPWAEVLRLYEKKIEKATKQRIDVEIDFHGTGTEADIATLVTRGQLDGLLTSGGGLRGVIPELKAIEMPFLFRSTAEADRVLDKVLTAPVEKLFTTNGLVFGFWNENGFQQLGTRFPVAKPGDFDGKAISATENPVNVELWRTFAAKPTPVEYTEVLPKLERGELDGFDQTLVFAVAMDWHKGVKHVTLTSHIYQPALVAYNKKWFDALPADLQKLLIAEGRKLAPQARAMVRGIEPKAMKALKDAGVKVRRLSAGERAKFEAEMKATRTTFQKTYSPDAVKLLEKIDAALGRKPRAQ
jgi:TRAP-type C4-dicarboxylate transport system substrate-binding protein